jgi:lysozyme
MSNAQGLDVSSWQNAFDWRGHPGLDFAAAKAYEAGSGEDPQFARNWDDMWSAFGGRLVRIGYCFGHPGDSPVTQADVFVQLVRDHGLRAGDHFALDLEVLDGQPVPEVTRWARIFSRRVNDLTPGSHCFAYTFADFAAPWGHWPLWEADWNAPAPRVPAPWKTWKLWQSAVRGTDVDQFNGDREEMLNYMLMPPDRR